MPTLEHHDGGTNWVDPLDWTNKFDALRTGRGCHLFLWNFCNDISLSVYDCMTTLF